MIRGPSLGRLNHVQPMPSIGKPGRPVYPPNDANAPRRHLTLSKTPISLRAVIGIYQILSNPPPAATKTARHAGGHCKSSRQGAASLHIPLAYIPHGLLAKILGPIKGVGASYYARSLDRGNAFSKTRRPTRIPVVHNLSLCESGPIVLVFGICDMLYLLCRPLPVEESFSS
jgi:hypothetical protein